MAIPGKGSEQKPANIRTITWGDLTWIDIIQPTEETTRYLGENYKFHPLDLEDCLSRRQLSKIEEYPQYLFVIFHFPSYDKTKRVSNILQWPVFVGDKYLITLRPGALKAVDEMFHECELNEEARMEYFSQGSGYLLYRIIDRAIDEYFSVLAKIMSLMEDIEDNVFNEEIEVGRELSILRRDIITQRRVMFPERALTVELESKLKRFSKIDLSVYFSDHIDHLNKICETLDECREVIDVFKDADYLLSSYRANRVTRVIAIIMAIVAPFLVVSCLFGMNVILPGGMQQGNLKTFGILLGVIFVMICGSLYLLRRKRLI